MNINSGLVQQPDKIVVRSSHDLSLFVIRSMNFHFRLPDSRILHARFLVKSCRLEARLASEVPRVILLTASVQTQSIWS